MYGVWAGGALGRKGALPSGAAGVWAGQTWTGGAGRGPELGSQETPLRIILPLVTLGPGANCLCSQHHF